MLSLEGRHVLITGAGSGLGRELALAFSNAGCRVTGFGRSADTLIGTQELCVDGAFRWQVVDVSDRLRVQRAIRRVEEESLTIDVLFNNAAVYPKCSFLDCDIDLWTNAILTNLVGVAYCCRYVLPLMINQGFGRIYNVGTFADGAPIPESSAYAASKGGLHGLTKAISADIESLGLDIRIHEWVPGHLRTQMSDYTGIDPQVSAGWAMDIVRKDEASFASALFVNSEEHIPPKRLKERLSSLLGLQRLLNG